MSYVLTVVVCIKYHMELLILLSVVLSVSLSRVVYYRGNGVSLDFPRKIWDTGYMYPNCGTYAGYKKHKNNKTKPCIECLVANRIYSRARYQKNGAKRQADSRARNIDKVRERERQKNRRRKAALSKPYNELQVIATYGGDCHICGLAIDFMATRKCGNEGWESGFHVDHLVPISKGGVDTLENVRPAHAVCNLQKASNSI